MSNKVTAKQGRTLFDHTRDAIALAYQADLNCLLWGPPGVGKTSGLVAMASMLGSSRVYVMTGSTHAQEDFGGFPTKDEARGVTVMLPLEWAKEVGTDPLATLFIDEINTAPPNVQAAMLRILNERYCGSVKLECRIVAAANPAFASAGGHELSKPVISRLLHFYWNPQAVDVIEGMKSGWNYKPPVLPSSWLDRKPKAQEDIVRFLEQRPDLLHTAPPQHSPIEYVNPAHATARTWDFAATALAACRAAQATAEVQAVLLEACIGKAALPELLEFLQTQDLDIDSYVSNPAKAQQLGSLRPDQQEAIFQAFNSRFKAKQVTAEQTMAFYTFAAYASKDLAYPKFLEIGTLLPGEAVHKMRDIVFAQS